MGSCSRKSFDSTNLYNTYYQWVSIFLMVQAIVFYIPRCIWLSMEGGLMNFLVKGTQGRVIEDANEKQNKLLDNYLEHVHNKFNKYAFCFFFCELLNILISVSQVNICSSAQISNISGLSKSFHQCISYKCVRQFTSSKLLNHTKCFLPMFPLFKVFITNAFLNYQFLDYGYLVYQYYR